MQPPESFSTPEHYLGQAVPTRSHNQNLYRQETSYSPSAPPLSAYSTHSQQPHGPPHIGGQRHHWARTRIFQEDPSSYYAQQLQYNPDAVHAESYSQEGLHHPFGVPAQGSGGRPAPHLLPVTDLNEVTLVESSEHTCAEPGHTCAAAGQGPNCSSNHNTLALDPRTLDAILRYDQVQQPRSRKYYRQ